MLTRRRFVVALVISVFVFATAAAYANLVRHTADPDMFWHIRTGQYIVQHHGVPTADPFSWPGTETRLSWMPQAWLFDVMAAGVYGVGGFAALYLATAMLFGLLSVLVMWLAYVRTKHLTLSAFIGVFALAGVMRSVAPRPQALTFVLLVAVALLLEKKRWYLALPLMVVAVNVHGPIYPLYLALFAYYVLPESPLVFLGACAVVFVQPFGLALLRYPFTSIGGDTALIEEFRATRLVEQPFLLVALALLAIGIDWRSVKLRDALLALALAALSLVAVRHMPYLFILGLPILAPYLRILQSPNALQWPDGVPPETLRFLMVGAILLAGVMIGIRGYQTGVNVDRGYPKAAVAWVKERPIERLWNNWSDGGYLLFNGVRSFVDGRGDPFSSVYNPKVSLAGDYIDSFYLKTDVRPLLDQYRVEYLLVGKKLALYRVLEQSKDFSAVYRDADYVVFRYSPARATASP